MKKRLIGTLLLGALFVSTSSVFVSCKDYDDDVKDLQEQINSLSGVVTQKETTINSSITSLQSALTTLENAYKTADDATLTAAKQALADAVAELEKAIKANYDSQVAKNAELDAAIIKAQTAADQAIKQLESKADAAVVKQLQDDLAAAQTALQNAINGKADQATVDALNTEVSNLKAAQADAKTALENAQKQLQDAINAKADQATVTALEAQVTNLKKALEDKDAELATAIENLNKAMAGKADEAEVTALQTKVNDLQKALEAKDVELANAINDAKKQITDVNTSLTNLETKVGTLSTDVAGAVKNIAELQTALNGQKKALEDAQAALEKAIADNTTAIGNNATAIANNGKTIEENKQAIADNLKAIETLQTTLTQLDTDMKKLIADEIKKVNDVLGTKADQATVDELKKAHETYVADNDKAVDAVKAKVQKAEENITALGTHVDEVETSLNTLVAALSKALRSLVYQPYLYVDGIESIEYPYLIDTTIIKQTINPIQRKRVTPYATYNDEGNKNIQGLSDYLRTSASTQEYFGPTWPVDYHLNPTKANPAWSDIIGWNRRNAEVITRSTAGNNGAIQVDQYYADGSTKVFAVKNGVLTVGLKVTQPQNLANHAVPTEEDGRPGYYTEERTSNGSTGEIAYKRTSTRQFDDIIALQVKTSEGDGEAKTITSDYAMIYPEAVWPEAIVWTKYHSKVGFSTVNFDEKCPYEAASATKKHVWDTPQEALGITDPTVYPDIELYWDSETGIKLSDLLGIHYIKDTKTLSSIVPGTMNLNSELFKQYGLSYKFELVDYSIDGNSTHDSKYCTLDEKDGTIIAWNVDQNGNTIKTHSATSVGREPLVRVIVSRGSRNILDGYILVHITEKAPEAKDLYVDNYPAQEKTWNLCDWLKVFDTDWAQFSKYVLTDKMDNLEKDNFDQLYGKDYNGVPDLLGVETPVNLGGETYRYDDVAIWNDKNGKPDTQCTTRDLPGQVRYYHNFQGTTNHRFEWYITDNELEEYLHDNPTYLTTPRTITKWFRYTRRDGQVAEYEHVWVKMTVNLKRATIASTGIKDKIDEYWFKWNGQDLGWDAVVWNPWYPKNWGNTKTFRQYLTSTFDNQNKVLFTNTSATYADNASATVRDARAKFYFTPYEFDIKAQDGTVYTITPRRGNGDQVWNAFVCRYLRWENDGTPRYNHIKNDGTSHNLHWYSATNDKTYTEHKWSTPENNKKIHEQCAIDYRDGVYTNNTLYAVKKSAYNTTVNYTPIATLNQSILSGQMDLIWRTSDNDITKEVLNAIGYFENDNQSEITPDFQVHWNIKKELHTMVGVIAHNGCYVALNVNEMKDGESNLNEGTFYTSWQRPINVFTNSQDVWDAEDNGSIHYTVDFLKIFDWRGPVEGYMWNDKQWLWAYYNIKSVIIDTRAGQVLTNLNKQKRSAANEWVKLNTVTDYVHLYTYDQTGARLIPANTPIVLPALAAYNSAEKNDDLLDLMGLKPVNNDKKLAFAGGIFYENNADNVEDFQVKVPVTMTYDWGQFTQYLTITINATLGNDTTPTR